MRKRGKGEGKEGLYQLRQSPLKLSQKSHTTSSIPHWLSLIAMNYNLIAGQITKLTTTGQIATGWAIHSPPFLLKQEKIN
jgi:hypothetical protein